MLFKEPKIIEISKYGDEEKGYLSVVEALDNPFPFEIKRVYWTYGAKEGVVKGNQANKRTHQLLIAIQGSATIELESKDGEKTLFAIDSPNKAMYIPPMHWRKVIPSKGAILLNLSSEKYSKEEILSNYQDFIDSPTY